MKWLSNLESIATQKKAGPCPYCNSSNTDYSIEKATKGKIGYGDVWCNDCRRAFHISRIDTSIVELRNPIKPEKLIY